MLATSSEIEIIGTAKNGKEALELIPKNNSQVICAELEMPVMDGLDLTKGLMATDPCAILVVSRLGQKEDCEKTFQLLEAGAIGVFPMSDYESELAFYASAQELVKKIKILSGVMVLRRRQILPHIAMQHKHPLSDDCSHGIPGMVVIGASTGGPQAPKKSWLNFRLIFHSPLCACNTLAKDFCRAW